MCNLGRERHMTELVVFRPLARAGDLFEGAFDCIHMYEHPTCL